jgi:hypothetical protein
MNRKHVTGIALLIALAAVAGLFALARTTGLAGAGSSTTTSALVQARTVQLDRYEATLRKQIASVGTTQALAPGAPLQAAQKVVYVRPAPIVRTIHRQHGDDRSSGGSDD